LADEIYDSVRFDSILCNGNSQFDSEANGVPMLAKADGKTCAANQFPLQDGYYQYNEEHYTVWLAY